MRYSNKIFRKDLKFGSFLEALRVDEREKIEMGLL
jgi:hypothetical protein